MDSKCGFRPGRSTTDQNFTLEKIFEKSWEYGKDVYICFVDLVKSYIRVAPKKPLGVLQEYVVTATCYWPSSHCTAAQ